MENLVSSWSINGGSSLPETYIFPIDKRPGKLTVPLSKSIPIIDLEIQDQTNIIHQILKASQDYGFFQVHTIISLLSLCSLFVSPFIGTLYYMHLARFLLFCCFAKVNGQTLFLLLLLLKVVNHGISRELMNETMSLIKEFHAMPAKEKARECSKDPNRSYKLYTSSENYATEEFHYWRDAVVHPCEPLDHHKQFWPLQPPGYR